MSGKAEWTFLVYMAGDNNLSAAGDRDLAEMRRVGSTDKVNIVVEFDNAGDLGTRRIHVKKDGSDEAVVSLGETDSGSPQVLLDFVRWGTAEFPAKRYALILWNHGSGWAPTEVDRIARSVSANDYTEREIGERSSSPLGRSFFRSTFEKVFSIPSVSDRAICSDDGSGHSLDTIELHNTIKRAVDDMGQPFDLLGMDACLMSNIEVAYQLRDQVRYIVASEENEPADGWPYDRVLGRLTVNPQISTAELATHIVDDYIRSYVQRGFVGDVTQTAIDASRIADLASVVSEFSECLHTRMDSVYNDIWKAQRESTRFWHNTLWDIGHFAKEFMNLSSDVDVVSQANAVLDAHAVGTNGAVIAEGHSGQKVEHCCGTTVYFVPPISDISRFYPELSFAQDFSWLPMLKAYHKA